MFNICYCSEQETKDKIKKCETCTYNAFKEVDKKDEKPFLGNKYKQVTLELSEDTINSFIKKCSKNKQCGEMIINQLMLSYCIHSLSKCIKNKP